jgi:hypothetical protein
MMRVRAHFEIPRELVDPQVAFLLLRPVAADAMRLQESVKRLRSTNGTDQGAAGVEDQSGGEG